MCKESPWAAPGDILCLTLVISICFLLLRSRLNVFFSLQRDERGEDEKKTEWGRDLSVILSAGEWEMSLYSSLQHSTVSFSPPSILVQSAPALGQQPSTLLISILMCESNCRKPSTTTSTQAISWSTTTTTIKLSWRGGCSSAGTPRPSRDHPTTPRLSPWWGPEATWGPQSSFSPLLKMSGDVPEFRPTVQHPNAPIRAIASENKRQCVEYCAPYSGHRGRSSLVRGVSCCPGVGWLGLSIVTEEPENHQGLLQRSRDCYRTAAQDHQGLPKKSTIKCRRRKIRLQYTKILKLQIKMFKNCTQSPTTRIAWWMGLAVEMKIEIPRREIETHVYP